MCVKFVCVLSLCVLNFVCVRRREEEAEKEPGIQNQKQEPHTKMWGMRKPLDGPKCERQRSSNILKLI